MKGNEQNRFKSRLENIVKTKKSIEFKPKTIYCYGWLSAS